MKPFFSWQGVSALLLAFSHGLAQDVEVTGERVNLRAAPSAESEIVGQASKGDRLLLAGKSDAEGWLPVAMPDTLSVWVYEPLAKGGIVQVPRLQVRAGPGINYTVLGVVERDQRLEVRNRKLDWIEIAPPPLCRVWISAAYARPVEPVVAEPPPVRMREPVAVSVPAPIAVPDKPVAAAPPPAPSPPRQPLAPRKPAVRKPPMPADASHRPPSRAAAEPPPAPKAELGTTTVVPGGLRPSPGLSQGDEAVYAGRLHRAGFLWRRPIRYRLVGQDDKGRAVTVCYILDEGNNLDAQLGREMVVSGSEYWIQGLRVPALQAARITLKE